MVSGYFKPYKYTEGASGDFEGEEKYIFISYAHADAPRVNRILNILHRHSLRMWSDKGIELSTDWYDSIIYALDHSCAFVGFLSHGVEQRSVIIKEIKRAIEKHKADESYKIIFVNIDRVSPNLFALASGDNLIRENIKKSQCLNLYKNGINENDIKRLINALWETGAVREGAEKPADADPLDSYTEQNAEYIYEKGAYYEDIETVRANGFRKLNRGSIDPYMAYPICMDNQWVPVQLIYDDGFMKSGLSAVKSRITEYQHHEFCRALLHNWQILINRAFVFNGDLFDIYLRDGSERNALSSLMCSGSVVLYLYTEESPAEKPTFQIDEGKWQRWNDYMDETAGSGDDKFIFCFKLDWNDKAINEYEIERVSKPFELFCNNTVYNNYLLEELNVQFGIKTEAEKQSFRNMWGLIQRDMQGCKTMSHNSSYKRQRFYEQFVTQPGTDVQDGIIKQVSDGGRINYVSFAAELKQTIDYVYETNLPNALGIQPFVPVGTRAFTLPDEKISGRHVKVTEVQFAVSEYTFEYADTFLEADVKDDFTLSQVKMMRELPEWVEYIKALTEGKKRSYLNELDFYDITSVYKKYQKFLAALPKLGIKVKSGGEAVMTVIYRIGSAKIVTEYSGKSRIIRVAEHDDISDMPELRHRVPFKVNYVCGRPDAGAGSGKMCLLTELCLFDGLTEEDGGTFFNSLLKHFDMINGLKSK